MRGCNSVILSAGVAFGVWTSWAAGGPCDHWTFNAASKGAGNHLRHVSEQNPQRNADFDENIISGIPGVEGEGLWCLPKATGRIRSAMILPKTGDFTLSFYLGFPEGLKGAQILIENGRMRVGVDAGGRLFFSLGGATTTATTSVADGKWHHLAVTRRNLAPAVWVDGRREAAGAATTAEMFGEDLIQWYFLSETNLNRMFFDDLLVFPRVVTAETMAALAKKAAAPAPTMSAADEESIRRRALRINPPFAAPEDYRALTIESKGLRPFAEQHDVCAAAVPWFDRQGRDLIGSGSIFGCAPLLYRFLRLEDGVPVYAQGIPYDGPGVRGAAVWLGKDGSFDLCCKEKRANRNVLVAYHHEFGAAGFGPGREIKAASGDATFALDGGRFAFVDVDGDGTDDLVETYANLGRSANISPNGGFPWPSKGNHPWTEIETPYSGVGRGYDVFGRWMGDEVVAEVQWSKGTVGADGLPRFGERRAVYVDMPEYPGVRRRLTWKMYMGFMGATAISAESGRYLALYGDMGSLAAFRIRMDGGDVFCSLPRPLLACGYATPHNYWINRILSIDMDGDGRGELLIDGNPGTIGFLKGGEPGSWTSRRAWIEGGAICGETLSAAARIDWDDDGIEDVVLSDASGWISLYRGTKDPYVYRAPVPFTKEGRPICLKGGDSGSLQGTVEKIWGYVKVAAGRWGDEKALVTVDITGDLLLHTRVDGNPLELRTRPFTRANGEKLKVAWRSRVDFAPTGFAGVPRPSLLLQDLDNDLAVAVPEAAGSCALVSFEKLRYADGTTVRPSGINGLSGRCHVSLVDWDGDGNEDIIFGNNGSCQKYFEKTVKRRPNAGTYILRNVGTHAAPRYAEAVPFILKASGKRLVFGWHNATPWITDLDGDGSPDLLVSAENGKVYAFRHDEIEVAEVGK